MDFARLLGIAHPRQGQQGGQAFGLGPVPSGGNGRTQRRLRQDGLGKVQKGLHFVGGQGAFFTLQRIGGGAFGADNANAGQATLQRIHILHHRLFEQPVRGAP